MTELPKTFDPAEIEARWYSHWEANGLFRPDRPGAEPWTIVNPPPNVTGSLHIGHALDNTLQDILTRHARLKGKDARWVVGTDHAGIATQMVVERNLASQGVKRTDMTRDQFVEHVQEWKAQSGGAITRQLRRLGCSMDWANERFTMDEGLTRATLKVFVDLYNEGLLYRDKRLVNWDPGLGTAISDLEVETREVQGKFWHLSYRLDDGSGAISVATTRPETMLADMAVAVNPADERYTALIGKRVRLPITGRLVPIIADDHADPELGSGAVKITPGHDFNDFEVGKRAGIEARDMLNMFDAKARIVQTSDRLIPEALIGLDRFEARTRVVAMLEEAGALERVEDRAIQTPYGDRSGEVIEPWLTDQWYVDAATLAKPAIEAVRQGRIRIVPKTWEKTFFNWMENIQPWCVSRQLWWGHRIPAWYGYPVWGAKFPKRNPGQMGNPSSPLPTFVAEKEADAIFQAERFYRENWDLDGKAFSVVIGDEAGLNVNGDKVTASIRQDPDVLDTWFSSALWPFATLGWPEDHSSPSLLGEGDHAQHGGGAAGVAGGTTSGVASPSASLRAPPPLASRAVPLPETSSGRNLGGRYPNDVLISGFDILFFWDARMMMQGLHFMGDVPFRTLYLHGLVRAADGQKMSKSKGNTVDPLGLIDRYGADALRFFMAAMESQGRDIKMDEKRVEGYRNFATKLWNAARFCQANGIGGSATLEPPAATIDVNKWIINRFADTLAEVDQSLEDLRFDAAAQTMYQFVWDIFCDQYLEEIKKELNLEVGRGETRLVAGWILDQILICLHPFMPFVTEELWHALDDRECDLIVATWPELDRGRDRSTDRSVDWSISANSAIWSARTELGIPPSTKMRAWFVAESSDHEAWVVRRRDSLVRRAKLEALYIPNRHPNTPPLSEGPKLSVVTSIGTIFLPLEGVIDLDAERTRLAKAMAAAEKDRDTLAARLANPSFVERAKPEAVEKARADHADKAAEAERLAAALGRLG